ncbi:hypothetical protein TNCV_2587381 [Trichonephila clavipes]|nr:hypothetical protein TNCV_2587381 [Trichonephila clavipes]
MLDHLEDNIRRVIADIRPQMLEKVIENWMSRLDYIRASQEMDLVPKMPAFLEKQSQLSIEDANETRLVISIRWVVEAANGQYKKWRTLNNIIPNV